MKQTDYYRAVFLESFPPQMEAGALYISTGFSTAGHLCPCGCGSEVVTKLSPARYSVQFDGEVSLSPSVAATGLECNSHYFITRGQVDWHAKLNGKQTQRAQERDRKAVADQRSSETPSIFRRVRGFFRR